VVELRVARHHSRRAEQVRLEHRPIPAWSTTDGGTITCIHGTENGDDRQRCGTLLRR
jgi:hypothetical protein